MKNEFLAKSNGETIMEHTENLINNFKNFFTIYSEINVDKELLLLACIYHDLGKINKKFQSKLSGQKQNGEFPHGLLSTSFIDSKSLSENGFDKSDIKVLSYSVALHHERDISEIEEEDFEIEIKLMNVEAEHFLKYLEKLQDIYFDYVNKNTEESLRYPIFKIENETFLAETKSRKKSILICIEIGKGALL